ncbi:MAG: alpha/beta hydrolase [Pedobacter sp.]
MKHLKQVIQSIKQQDESSSELQQLIWELICYSPKMPLRQHQQQLINLSEQILLKADDTYFSKKKLNFPCFIWGEGIKIVLLVHGWGSKALDFYDLIQGLLSLPDVKVIAFDAPGNGSAEGHLSNLFLFVDAIKEIEKLYGVPHAIIGHSLGGMAAVRVLHETRVYPELLITIAPLINLKDNFKGSMDNLGLSDESQQLFLDDFETLYQQSINNFHVPEMYDFAGSIKHMLIYEQNDTVSPITDIEEFLHQYPEVIPVKNEHTSHAKIISDAEVISNIVQQLKVH